MTRAEYLAELDSHLISLPKEERDMAVRFYEEYFDEAGPENEQAVIADLGKPFALARSIIGETSAYSKSMVYLKYKESKPMPQNSTGVFASLRKPEAFENNDANVEDTADDIMPQGNIADVSNSEQDVPPNGNNGAGMFDEYYSKGQTESTPPPAKKEPIGAGWIIFWVFLGIFIGFPLACAVIPVILAIILVMFAFGLVSAVCLISAIIVLISGIMQIPVSVPIGLGFIFASLLVAGIGLILLSASLAFFFKLIPCTVKGIAKLFSKRRAA
ncbi:MAG: DUF1700 domain-containing protein [Oscillospiraceae bacterium]